MVELLPSMFLFWVQAPGLQKQQNKEAQSTGQLLKSLKQELKGQGSLKPK